MKVKAIFEKEHHNAAFKNGAEYNAYMLYESNGRITGSLVQTQLVIIDKQGDAIKESDAYNLYNIKFEVL